MPATWQALGPAILLVMDDGNRRFDEGRLALNIMLAAWAHGVGSCIASIYPDNNKARSGAARRGAVEVAAHGYFSLG